MNDNVKRVALHVVPPSDLNASCAIWWTKLLLIQARSTNWWPNFQPKQVTITKKKWKMIVSLIKSAKRWWAGDPQLESCQTIKYRGSQNTPRFLISRKCHQNRKSHLLNERKSFCYLTFWGFWNYIYFLDEGMRMIKWCLRGEYFLNFQAIV